MPTIEVKQETLDLARQQLGLAADIADAEVVEKLAAQRGEDIELARSLLPEDDKTPPNEVIDRMITATHAAGKQASEQTQRADKAVTDLNLSRQQIDTLTKERDALNLSRTTTTAPTPPSPAELHYASRAVKAARMGAIRGGLAPACADAAEKRLLSKPVDLGTITLSRTVEADDRQLADGMARLLDFYEIVQSNVPTPAAGEQTAIALARSVPGQPEKPSPVNPYAGEIAAVTGSAAA